MMPITEEIHAFLTANAAAQIQRDDEYLDAADGLLHCKTCHGLRQTVIPAPGGTGFLRPRCLCPCQSAAEKQRKAAEEKRERLERIQRRKAHGLQDRRLYDCTFANDNGKTPGLTAKAKRYVEHWEDAAQKNIGLLLFGDVGTGKSFLAGCIANALLEQDVPVLIQSAYEDKVLGRIPESVCVNLLNQYEAERREKQERCKELTEQLAASRETESSVDAWLDMMQDYAQLEELDRPTLVRLIQKIEISERYTVDDHEERDIHIYYNFVGYIEA